MSVASSYTPSELRLLVADESDTIEKKTGTGRMPLQEAMVSMSNTLGGTIFLGVADDGTVVGQKLNQTSADRIHDAALAARDIGRYSMQSVQVGAQEIVAVEVLRREEGFAQTSDGRVLVRRGARNVAIFGADLARFIQERALRRFELTPVDLGVDRADEELVTEVAAVYGWSPADDHRDRLAERGLATKDGNLTIAGALFLTDPATSLGQQKAVVEVRRYPEAAPDYDRRELFGGPLHRQVEAATRFVLEELGSELIVTGLYRHDLPRVPGVVLREGLANAVAHRSYEMQGTAVVIELHPDLVVITSPGGLPEPVTIENIRQAQAARNQCVIDVLRRFRLAEDAGRGIDVMEDQMRAALLDPPRFSDDGRTVRVELPLHGPITARERAWVQELEAQGELEGGDRLVLVHAGRGERLTNASARILLSVDEAEARRTLQRLTKAGLLRQHGERGGTHYTLVEQIAPPAAYRLSSEEIAALIIDAASVRPLTNERVRELTGLGRDQALALLRSLVREGQLRRVGERRGTRYVRP